MTELNSAGSIDKDQPDGTKTVGCGEDSRMGRERPGGETGSRGSGLGSRRNMQGKIIRGVGGFYYVYAEGRGIFECRARGIFRKDGTKPLVGDNVRISETIDTDKQIGHIDDILPRKNSLIRPAAANIDQALVIFACACPEPNLNLLDRFLITMADRNIPVLICFNKTDLAPASRMEELKKIYENCGCPVMTASFLRMEGLDPIRKALDGKTTVVAGPSGVGKSSLTNLLAPDAGMEIGTLSRRIERGKQTTRHTQLVRIWEDTYFLDTPGFSSLYLTGIEYRDLPSFYPEFETYASGCRFPGCMHISEPDCAVKNALREDKISRVRYENYLLLADELKNQRRY